MLSLLCSASPSLSYGPPKSPTFQSNESLIDSTSSLDFGKETIGDHRDNNATTTITTTTTTNDDVNEQVVDLEQQQQQQQQQPAIPAKKVSLVSPSSTMASQIETSSAIGEDTANNNNNNNNTNAENDIDTSQQSTEVSD